MPRTSTKKPVQWSSPLAHCQPQLSKSAGRKQPIIQIEPTNPQRYIPLIGKEKSLQPLRRNVQESCKTPPNS